MSWDWEKLKEQQQKNSSASPQMDEIVDKIKDTKLSGGPVILIILMLLAFLVYDAFYKIEEGEVGVVQRFGEYKKTTSPGLNWKMPMGIDTVRKVKKDRIYKEAFGFVASDQSSKSRYPEIENMNVSLMLTGDLNVAVVPWIVQYQVKDEYKYLFKVDKVITLLRDLSEAAMRQVVGDRSITEVINKRKEMADEAQVLLQKELDDADTGIKIKTIEMKRTNVPEKVQSSFNRVNQAIQEKEKLIYEARENYNKFIPTAKGEAEKIIKEAEGYALERVNKAKGDVARFIAVYEEYKNAQDVTRKRLFLEMAKDLYPKLKNIYIIDEAQKNFLPLLNLEK